MNMMNDEAKRNGLLKNSIKAMIGILIVMAAIVLTSCGGGVNGTWYYISDPYEDNSYNLTFKDGETVNYDYVDFSYTKNGNDITIDVPFDTKELTQGSYEGHDVIFEDGDETPSWARTLKEAQELNEIIYGESYDEQYDDDGSYEETSVEDDMNAQVSFNEDEAAGYNSLFVKSGEKFLLLAPVNMLGGDDYDVIDGLSNNGWISAPYGDVPGTLAVPVIKKGDQLVYFSKNFDPEDDGELHARKVKDEGYTIPLCFINYTEDGEVKAENMPYADWDSLTNMLKLDKQPEENYESDEDNYDDYEEDSYYDNDFDTNSIEAINDKTVEELFRSGSLKTVHRKGNGVYDEEEDITIGILPCSENEEVTIGYRDGTAYKEAACTAGIKAYFPDSKDEISLPVTLGKESYATVDTSKLDPGLYCVDSLIFEVQ